MDEQPFQNFMTVRPGGKAVPYGGNGVAREDGEANFGFRDLKGRPDRLAEIPELKRDPALGELVARMNDPDSSVFTVGCASGPVDHERGFGWSGYVEFAWDADEAITDAQCYFPLLFHFEHYLREIGFNEPASFEWEIYGARFFRFDAAREDVHGFTATLWIKVGLAETAEAALASWQVTMAMLTAFLTSHSPREGEPITPLPDPPSAATPQA